MALAKDVVSMGLPAEIAKRSAWDLRAVTTTGTTQGSAGGLLVGPGNILAVVTPHAGDGAVTLPANAGLGDEVLLVNSHATLSFDLFPNVGGSIIKLATNGGTPVATGQSFRAIKVSATEWLGRLVATPAAT